MPISAEQWRVSIGRCYTHIPVVSRNVVKCDPWSILLDLLLSPLMMFIQWPSGETPPQHTQTAAASGFSVVSQVVVGGVCRKINESGQTLLAVFLLVIVASLLLRSGNVEQNPGPVDRLVLKDLVHVRRALWDTRVKWYGIGLELNLDPTTLAVIRENNHSDVDNCFTAMLSEWLKQTSPQPSWSALVEALKQPTVGFSLLAEQIKKKYIDPPGAEGESSPDGQLTTEDESSGSTAGPTERGASKPHSKPSKTDPIHVHIAYLEEEFLHLANITYDTLVANRVDVKTCRARATALDLSLKQEHQDFISKHLLSVKEGTTLSDLWVRFNQYWDFLNYTLLEHVIKTFHLKSLQTQMDDYVSDLQEFRKTTHLCDFIDCWSKKGVSLPETELQEFVVRKKGSWQETTLEDLEELKKTITHKFFLPSFVLILKKASEANSFVITWAIPAPIAAALREDIENMGDREFFKEHQIDLITINGQECYYSPMKKYSAYLKGVYSSKAGKNIAPFKLARIVKKQVHHQTMDSFTRSSIRGDVDDVIYTKYPLTEDEVGWTNYPYHDRKAKLVLIEGAPGVGKTTFSSQFCYKWSQGEVLQDYSLLVLLPLRDNRVKSAKTIADLFHHSQLQQTVAQELESSQGEGVILWLEGLDELDEDLRTKSSIFLDLIHGQILPKATIFVTSRPWASLEIAKKLSEETDQHIELLTTPKIQLDCVLRGGKMDTSLSQQFVEYTSSNAAILAAMHTPITADIAADVFEWSQETQSPPPTTMTQLYTTFTLKLLTQHLSSKEGSKLRRFEDLPPGVYKQFWSLCELAYNGLLKQQLVFSDLPSEFESLGLMKAVEQLYDEDHTHKSYHFIHLTLQEYLGALYISRLSSQEQNTLIHQHHKSSHFKMSLRFLAGISHLHHLSPELTQQCLGNDKLTFFHWLFEAGDVAMVTSILGEGKMRVDSSYSWTPLDFNVTGYCLSLSNCGWELEFIRFIDDDGLKMFSRGVLLNSDDKCRGYISRARFSWNTITSDGMRWFSQLPQRVFHGLVTLDLSQNKLDKAALSLLANTIPSMTSLETLNIEGNPSIGNGGAVDLLKSLCTSNTTLRDLDLYGTGIGEEDSIALVELLACSNLTTLRINKISSDSVMAIMDSVSKNSSLEDLTMERSQFTLESMAVLLSVLQQPQCQLKELVIWNCTITSEGAVQLAAGLTNNHSLKRLVLSYNPIGDDGAVALADMLSENKHMEYLRLDGCKITSEGAVQLAAVLTNKNSTLKTLRISRNTIGPEGAAAFAKMIQENKSLEELELYGDDSLGEEGVHQLIVE